MSGEAGMPNQSDTPSCSDDSEDSDTVDPTVLYSMEEFIAEQSVLHNFLERINVKIRAKVEAQQTGTSCRQNGSRKFVGRNHEHGHERLVADFFSENPVCDDQLFRTRYQMRRPLFLRIVRALSEWSPYFTRRRDGFSRQGLSPLQKCTAAVRMLARGSPADAVDEYVQIGESTAMECLAQFAEGVIMGYYLADGIYPEWTAFVKTIPHPQTEKERLFARYHDEARKVTQQAFGVLQSRFPIVCGPTRFFQRSTLGKIIQACIILHNMTIEDEKDMQSSYFEPSEPSGISAVLPSNINNGPADCFATVFQRNDTTCAQPAEIQIRRDLIDHIWQQFGPFGDE